MGTQERELVQLMRDFPEVEDFSEFFDPKQLNAFPTLFKSRKPQEFPKSDYQATYNKKNVRPRSNKRPARTPLDPRPPKMETNTSQRREFIDHGNYKQRPTAFKIEEEYKAPSIPVESKTWYSAEFTNKPIGQTVMHTGPKDTARFSRHATFHANTTNKEHYKGYKPDRTVAFQELPSFTGSILYPGRQTEHETTNQSVFKGEFARRPDAFDPVSDNHIVEGKLDFQTTNRSEFTTKVSQRPPAFDAKPQMGRFQRGNFQKESQSMADFPKWKGDHRAVPAEPAPATISLKFNNKASFGTEQREQFPGIDTSKHTVPRSTKVEEEYKVPDIKFETQTNQKLDYKHWDLKQAMMPRARGPPAQPREKARFDGRTTNKSHYPGYSYSSRLRHGDFHEAQKYGFVPPMSKFEGESTTQSTFVPKKAMRQEPFVPEESSMGRDGQQIFDTQYKLTYKGKQPQVKPSQISLIRQELLRRRREREQPQAAMAAA